MTHSFDPMIIQFGAFAISWYSVLYTLGFLIVYLYLIYELRENRLGITRVQLRRYLAFVSISALIGSRLVHVFIYSPSYYLNHLSEIFQYWKGGLAQHGALLGIFVCTLLFGRVHRKDSIQILDALFFLYPISIFLGRIGNFVNGELWGRVAKEDNSLAIIFPKADLLPRHPSQLYEAVGEGAILFAVVLASRHLCKRARGAVTLSFVFGYATIRFFIEFFREPDGELYELGSPISTGQLLCLMMMLLGFALYRKIHVASH